MNNNNISVTIGIPIYNVADCLEPSLLSALSQTYQNIEYILVDDCGTDNSMEIAERIISQSDRKDRVRIVHHTVNKGLGEARNTAIAHTETDYLYFMDSDDILPLDAIDNLVQLAIKYDHPDIVIGSHVQRTIAGEENVIKSSDNECFLNNRRNILAYYKHHNITVSSWNKLFSVTFLKRNNIRYIHRIHEDHYFALQELQFADSIVLTSTVTYQYLLRTGSITNGLGYSEKTVNALCQVQQDIKTFVKTNNSNGVVIYNSYIKLMYLTFSLALNINPQIAKSVIDKSALQVKDLKYLFWPGKNLYVKAFLLSALSPKNFRYKFIVILFSIIDNLLRIKKKWIGVE